MDKYIETNRIQLDGCVVVIHRPVLDEKERAEREQSVSTGLSKVLADYYKQRGLM